MNPWDAWADIEQDENYTSASDDGKAYIRQKYWDEKISSTPEFQSLDMPDTEKEGMKNWFLNNKLESPKEPIRPIIPVNPTNTENLPESRFGVPGDIVSGLASGVVGLGEMAARDARAFDPPGGTDIVRNAATSVMNSAEGLRETYPRIFKPSKQTMDSGFRKAIYGGFEAIPASVGVPLGIAAATASAPAWATIGAVGAGAALIFGAAEFDQYMEEATKAGKSYEESLPYALTSGAIEGGFEGLTDIVGAKLFGLTGGPLNGFKSTVKEMLTRNTGRFLKDLGKQGLIEIPTEMVQADSETLIRNLQGISDENPLKQALGAIGPAAVMTVVFGASGHYMGSKRRKAISEALTGENIDPETRQMAVDIVADAIKEKDPDVAKQWQAQAATYIQDGNKSIPIDIEVSEWISEKTPELAAQPQTEGMDEINQRLVQAIEQSPINQKIDGAVRQFDEAFKKGQGDIAAKRPMTIEKLTIDGTLSPQAQSYLQDQETKQQLDRFTKLPGQGQIIQPHIEGEITGTYPAWNEFEGVESVNIPQGQAKPTSYMNELSAIKEAERRGDDPKEIENRKAWFKNRTGLNPDQPPVDISYPEMEARNQKDRPEYYSMKENEEKKGTFHADINHDRIGYTLDMAIQDFEGGEPGKRVRTENAEGEQEWKGYSSTYPQWFKNQGWTKVEAINALNRAKEGKPLGIRQAAIVESALEAGVLQHKDAMLEYAGMLETDPTNKELLETLDFKTYSEMRRIIENDGGTGSVLDEIWARHQGNDKEADVGEIKNEIHRLFSLEESDIERESEILAEYEKTEQEVFDGLREWERLTTTQKRDIYNEEIGQGTKKVIPERSNENQGIVEELGKEPVKAGTEKGRTAVPEVGEDVQGEVEKKKSDINDTYSDKARPLAEAETGIEETKPISDSTKEAPAPPPTNNESLTVETPTQDPGTGKMTRDEILSEFAEHDAAFRLGGLSKEEHKKRSERQSLLRSIGFKQFGIESMDDVSESFRKVREPSIINKEIKGLQKKLNKLNANRKRPFEGSTRASITTYSANAGKTAESIDALKKELKVSVERAIAEGKSIPQEVLKNYPGLSKTVEPTSPLVAEIATTETPAPVVGKKYDKVKASSIETPLQGSLNSATQRKKELWNKIKSLREQIKKEPLGGNKSSLRLELLKTQSLHKEAVNAEIEASQGIEKSANEAGKTTTRLSASSTDRASTTHLSKRATEAIIKRLTRTWKNAAKIEVVQSQDELPDEVWENTEFDRDTSIMRGVFISSSRGSRRVILVADNIADRKLLVNTLFEETLGHDGIRQTLGKDYDTFLYDLYNDHSAEIEPVAEHYKLDTKQRKDRIEATDEWLAKQIAGDTLPAKIWARIVRLFRDFLRKIDPHSGYTANEIKDLARRTIKQGVKEERGQVGVNEFTVSPRFSLEKAIKSIRDNPNFRKWFGDSKTIDENGNPIVFYHGTSYDFSEFDPRASTIYKDAKNAMFFTSKASVADSYLPSAFYTPDQKTVKKTYSSESNIMPVYIKMENPMVVDYFGGGYKEGQYLEYIKEAKKEKKDGVIFINVRDVGVMSTGRPESSHVAIAFSPTQIKSIYNTGEFNPENPDIRHLYAGEKAKVSPTTNLAKAQDQEQYSVRFNAADPQAAKDAHTQELLKKYLGKDYSKTKAQKIVKEESKRFDEVEDEVIKELPDKKPRYYEKGRTDTHFFERWFGSPEFSFLKHGEASKEIFHSAQDRGDNFHVHFRDMADSNNVDQTKIIDGYRKEQGKQAYRKLQDLLVNADMDKVIHTEESLKKGGYSDPFIKAWEAFRNMCSASLKKQMAEIQKIVDEAKAQGKPLPVMSYKDDTGKRHTMSLRVAIAEMGKMEGYYFPRNRKDGRYRLYATAEGKNPFLKYFDLKTSDFLANKNIKLPLPIDREIRRLKKEGYTIAPITRSASMSEDVFEQFGSTVAMQKIIERGLDNISKGEHTLQDFGYTVEEDNSTVKPKNSYENERMPIRGIQFSGVYESPDLMSKIKEGAEVVLKREPKNKHDKNAIGVFIKGEKERYGYVPREIAGNLSHLIDNGAVCKCKIESIKGTAKEPKIILSLSTQAVEGLKPYEADKENTSGRFIIKGNFNAEMNELFKSNGARFYGKDVNAGWHITEKQETAILKDLAKYPEMIQDVQLAFSSDLIMSIADIFKARGARRSRIKRKDAVGTDVTIGYETDPLIAITQHMTGIAGGMAKGEMLRRMMKAVMGRMEDWDQTKYPDYMDYKKNVIDKYKIDPSTQKNMYNDVMVYIKEQARNEEFSDRVIGFMKGMTVLKYLGGRPASAIVNLTSLVTSVPANMSAKGKIPYHKTLPYMARALSQYTKFRRGDTKGMDKDLVTLFETIHTKGWATPQFNHDALAYLQTRFGRSTSWLIEKSMLMFGVTEHINRVATIAGSFMAVKDLQGKGYDYDKAVNTAKEISDGSHGQYGKATLPKIAQGQHAAAQVAKCFVVFSKFSHTYIQAMVDMGMTKGQRKDALYMAFAPAILFGGGSAVGAKIVMAAIGKAIGADDPEEDFYNWVSDYYGSNAETYARFGLPGLAGASLKGSLAIEPDIPTQILDLFGAPGGVISDVWEGGKSIAKGDYYKGTEKIMPSAIGSVMKGVREYQEGVTLSNHAPVFYGSDQLKPSLAETAWRVLSFNPSRISGVREKQWKEYQVEQDYAERQKDIYDRYRKFIARPNAEQTPENFLKSGLLEDIAEFNNRLIQKGLTGRISPITRNSIRTMLRRSFRPSKKERTRNLS